MLPVHSRPKVLHFILINSSSSLNGIATAASNNLLLLLKLLSNNANILHFKLLLYTIIIIITFSQSFHDGSESGHVKQNEQTDNLNKVTVAC